MRNGHVSTVRPVKAALDGDGEFQTTPTAGPAAASRSSTGCCSADSTRCAARRREIRLPSAPPTRSSSTTGRGPGRDEASPEQRRCWPAASRRVSGIARMRSHRGCRRRRGTRMRLSWPDPERPLQLSTRADAVLGRRDGTHTWSCTSEATTAQPRRRLAYDAVLETVSLRRPPAAIRGLPPDAGRTGPSPSTTPCWPRGRRRGRRRPHGPRRPAPRRHRTGRPTARRRYCAHRDRCEPARRGSEGPGGCVTGSSLPTPNLLVGPPGPAATGDQALALPRRGPQTRPDQEIR